MNDRISKQRELLAKKEGKFYTNAQDFQDRITSLPFEAGQNVWLQNSDSMKYEEPPVLHPAVPSSQATSTVDAIPTVPPALQNKDSTPKAPRTPRAPRTSSRITKGIPPTRLGLPEH